MRKVVDVDELIKRRDEILEDLHKLPFKERDYSEYRKIYMKIKYYTNENDRNRQLEYTRNRIKKIYDNEEQRKKYNEYQLNMYHNRKANINNVNTNVVVF